MRVLLLNSGFKPRYRTPANVLDEVEQMLERYHPSRIRIEDETFGLHMGRTKAILEGIISRGLHERVRLLRLRPASTGSMRSSCDLLKTANFEMLELGVETGNPKFFRRSRRGSRSSRSSMPSRSRKATA